MHIQNTFSDIRNCFLDIQNNYFGYPKKGINVNSACHTRSPQLKRIGFEGLAGVSDPELNSVRVGIPVASLELAHPTCRLPHVQLELPNSASFYAHDQIMVAALLLLKCCVFLYLFNKKLKAVFSRTF